MSSSLSATQPITSTSSIIGSNRATGTGLLLPPSAAQFREIHKNTWLKRLNSEGRKITVGPKKSERSWVVFCVHDDSEALLEGYAEPRQAASHMPEWIVSLQDTLHISHALIPNSHDFEFVVTLSNEVLRFHAMSWEIMQEWVDTLRSKLREMKILSPRENLYTKLPEVRAPLLPTRDPTSPLPAPPPVPAAIVPGVERIATNQCTRDDTESTRLLTTSQVASTTTTISMITTTSRIPTTSTTVDLPTTSTNAAPLPNLTSMSNTLTQNLLNMLSDPISMYSEQLNEVNSNISNEDDVENEVDDDDKGIVQKHSVSDRDSNTTSDDESPILRKPCILPSVQLLPGSSFLENSIRVDIGVGQRSSADQIINMENFLQCERLIPRPQTSRSMSAGAADKSKKQKTTKNNSNVETNNITELDVSQETNIIGDKTPSITSIAAKDCLTTTKADPKTNVTIIQVSTNNIRTNNGNVSAIDSIIVDQKSTNADSHVINNYYGDNNVDVIVDEDDQPPKLPTKNIIGEIFKFPEAKPITTTKITNSKQHEYKSNVQIIPSNTNSSTIQVLGQSIATTPNQYSTPVRKTASKPITTTAANATIVAGTTNTNSVTTMVHVIGNITNTTSCSTPPPTLPNISNSNATTSVSVYGTCYTVPKVTPASTVISNIVPASDQQQNLHKHHQQTPILNKKIILSANTSGITNITVNNNDSDDANIMRQTAISKESNVNVDENSTTDVKHNVGNIHYEKVFLSSSIPHTNEPETSINAGISTPTTHNFTKPSSNQHQSPRLQSASINSSATIINTISTIANETATNGISNAENIDVKRSKQAEEATATAKNIHNESIVSTTRKINGSPALPRRHVASPNTTTSTQMPNRPPLFTRGLTEAVITCRSRRDFHYLNQMNTPIKIKSYKTNHVALSNNNFENNVNVTTSSSGVDSASHQTPQHAAVSRTNSESLEQRRRSSSTSDAQSPLQRVNQRVSNNNGAMPLRIQQPPQPFRNVENGMVNHSPQPASSNTHSASAAAKRLTLREQQVMQLRREIMHPGGVRLQLRRKDCVGSIAWVDAFGAVWIAGWKQKEHPVLYNALHIGDQLLSIAGVSIANAAEANKIIRNANTLFVEVLVRRIPFGRGYAIRREREGQCLGLIRDGNTSTIVDIVPNSLAARHGLPPKAQSCDGSTLTFWILTEINGRPLNLFFKENEIRDRLNSVGRDISILVQPSDLITKLKKQLKSLRGYKDYLVQ